MPKERTSQRDADRKERASWDEWNHETQPKNKAQQRTHARAWGKGR